MKIIYNTASTLQQSQFSGKRDVPYEIQVISVSNPHSSCNLILPSPARYAPYGDIAKEEKENLHLYRMGKIAVRDELYAVIPAEIGG
jgi:hypothetical protein